MKISMTPGAAQEHKAINSYALYESPRKGFKKKSSLLTQQRARKKSADNPTNPAAFDKILVDVLASGGFWGLGLRV